MTTPNQSGQTVQLFDPSGRCVGAVTPGATSTQTLASALQVPESSIVVIAVDAGRWALAMFPTSGPVRLLGPECGDVPDPWTGPNKESMCHEAWLDLLEQGWTRSP